MAFELRISYWSSDVCSSDLFYAPYFEISDVGRHGSVGRLIRGRERQANILRVEKLKRILVGCVKSSDVEPAPPISQAEIGLGAHFHVGKFFLARLLERRSEEHTSELQSLMRISYAVFCLKKKQITKKII